MNWYLKVVKNYVSFSGRARRKEYWMFFLINIIITYGIMGIGMALESTSVMMLANLYSLALLLPSLAVAVRRMHDVGKSGWFILIPIYNLILLCTNGNIGSNEYGPDPKSEGAEIKDHLVN